MASTPPTRIRRGPRNNGRPLREHNAVGAGGDALLRPPTAALRSTHCFSHRSRFHVFAPAHVRLTR